MEEKIYKAVQALNGLKASVAVGETKYQEFIDVFEPIVEYAIKMHVIDNN